MSKQLRIAYNIIKHINYIALLALLILLTWNLAALHASCIWAMHYLAALEMSSLLWCIKLMSRLE